MRERLGAQHAAGNDVEQFGKAIFTAWQPAIVEPERCGEANRVVIPVVNMRDAAVKVRIET